MTNERRAKEIFHSHEWDYIDASISAGQTPDKDLVIIRKRAQKVVFDISFKYTNLAGDKVIFFIGRDSNNPNGEVSFIECLVSENSKWKRTMNVDKYGNDVSQFLRTGITGKPRETPKTLEYYETKVESIRDALQAEK